MPKVSDYGTIYIVFAFLIGRFLGVDHPKAIIDEPLDIRRKILGWIALVIFIISFTPRFIYFEINQGVDDTKPKIEEKRDPNIVENIRDIPNSNYQPNRH